MAFGVDTPTIDKVRDILIPPVVNTAPVSIVPVQVIQTPIVPSSPIYFGSTQSVENSTPSTPTMVQLQPMNELIVHNDTRHEYPTGTPPFTVLRTFLKDSSGNFVLDENVKVEYIANGNVIWTGKLNAYHTFGNEKESKTPGDLFMRVLPAGVTSVTVRANGLEQVINL